ncbi:MAG: hypothetical protein ACFFD3_17375 [Candidatus Thorarchaeota archaeon]
MPYPSHLLIGKLNICGLSYQDAGRIVAETRMRFSRIVPTEYELHQYIGRIIPESNRSAQEKFKTIVEYERARREEENTPPLIVILEGSSATGKSMLSLPIIAGMGTTRILSTDSVRQVLRSIYSSEDYPELFCHTYQAHKFALEGPEHLEPTVRGFIAQVQRMTGTIKMTIGRYLSEGAEAVVEGVHILPGSLQHLGPGILELLVHPSSALHREMFMSKHVAGGLKSVSAQFAIREKEFDAARVIQEFMLSEATRNEVRIIEFVDYASAMPVLFESILTKMDELTRLS